MTRDANSYVHCWKVVDEPLLSEEIAKTFMREFAVRKGIKIKSFLFEREAEHNAIVRCWLVGSKDDR